MLGNQICEARNWLGMSQDELGAKLNIKGGTVSSWETGSSRPNSDKLRELSKVLGVPTDFLLETGNFEHWDDMKTNQEEILRQISTATKMMSYDMLEGVDERTFIRLINTYDVKINTHEDGTVGVSVTTPVPANVDYTISPDMLEDDILIETYHSFGQAQKKRLMSYMKYLSSLRGKEAEE